MNKFVFIAYSCIQTRGSSIGVVTDGLLSLKHLMCSCDPPIQEVIDAGLVDDLISFLSAQDDKVKANACCILANVAAGDHEQSGKVLPAMPILMQFLAASDPNLQDQACWTIGNLAGDSDEYRTILMANGVMKPLVDLVLSCGACTFPQTLPVPFEAPITSASQSTTSATSIAQTAAWALSNMARGSTPAKPFLDIGNFLHNCESHFMS